jgi:hypothetical protein
MAEGDGTVYNYTKKYLMDGVYDLDAAADDIQFTLHDSYSPDIDTHDIWADVSASEYASGSGYAAGGATLANQATSVDTGDDEGVLDGDNITWTSLGPLSPATPSDTICWDDTQTTPADPLILFFELGVTATNGGDYTLDFNTEGILNLT